MKITVTEELRVIFREILNENKTSEEWSEIESDDMFQSEHYTGGFDATEGAFCFSFYSDVAAEYWFQLTLDELPAVVDGTINEIDVRPAG